MNLSGAHIKLVPVHDAHLISVAYNTLVPFRTNLWTLTHDIWRKSCSGVAHQSAWHSSLSAICFLYLGACIFSVSLIGKKFFRQGLLCVLDKAWQIGHFHRDNFTPTVPEGASVLQPITCSVTGRTLVCSTNPAVRRNRRVIALTLIHLQLLLLFDLRGALRRRLSLRNRRCLCRRFRWQR